MDYFSSVLAEPAAQQAWRVYSPQIQRDVGLPFGQAQNVAGLYSSIEQIPIGLDVKRALFQKLGTLTSGNEGYQPWMADAGVGESGQPIVSGQLSDAGRAALGGYQFDWRPSGTRNEGMLRVLGPGGNEVGSFQQTDASTTQSALEAAALAAAGFGGVGLMGLGPLSGLGGMLGGAGEFAPGFAPGAGMGADAAANVGAWASSGLPSGAMMPSIPGLGAAEAAGAGLAGVGAGAPTMTASNAAGELGRVAAALPASGGGGSTPFIPGVESAASGHIGNALVPPGVNVVNGGGIMSTGPSGISSLLSDVPGFLKNNAGSLASIASGLYGMNLAGQAREASDPFGPYRAGYAQKLAALEANPGSIVSRPGFEAGLEAIQRKLGATGYLGSGNNVAALSRYAGDFYTQEANRLAGLAGAGQAPGAGQFQAADLTGRSLGSVGYGLGQIFDRFVGRGP